MNPSVCKSENIKPHTPNKVEASHLQAPKPKALHPDFLNQSGPTPNGLKSEILWNFYI